MPLRLLPEPGVQVLGKFLMTSVVMGSCLVAMEA